MLRKAVLSCFLLLLAVVVAAQQPDPEAPGYSPRGQETPGERITGPFKLAAGIYAVFHTTDGDFVAQLYPEKAPKTVENFVGLASGKKPWTHPITLTEKTEPLYNNTAIYQIVQDIAIRGGDPINKGVGGPGYNLETESSPDLTFMTPGMLAMERAGSQASGSRWFIALTLFPGWDDRFSIFGRVVAGLDVVRSISRQPTRRPSVPLDPTMVNSVEILEVPANRLATASFTEERGKRFLSVDPNYEVLASATETTATDAATTETTATAAGESGGTTMTDVATTVTEGGEGIDSVMQGTGTATGVPQ